MKRFTILLLLALVMTLVLASTALAGSATGGGSGMTLIYPDNMTTCEPTFHITTTGVPASFSTRYNLFVQVGPGQLQQIATGTSNGNLDVTYSPPPLDPGTSQTYAVFVAVFNANNLLKLKLSGKWTVTCEG
ncbi:MAG: hypothetical protein IAE79_19730 [Anaerolinea sp.]|nr:hypothetical protein [Anaerolinea sp.]